MKLPDSDIPQEELDSFLAATAREFEEHQENLARFERNMRRAIVAFTIASCLLILVSLAGCGGGEEVECRPDFVGPPVPSQAHLPICQEQS